MPENHPETGIAARPEGVASIIISIFFVIVIAIAENSGDYDEGTDHLSPGWIWGRSKITATATARACLMLSSNRWPGATFPLILTFSFGEKGQPGGRATIPAARPAMPAPGFRQQSGDDSPSPRGRGPG